MLIKLKMNKKDVFYKVIYFFIDCISFKTLKNISGSDISRKIYMLYTGKRHKCLKGIEYYHKKIIHNDMQ